MLPSSSATARHAAPSLESRVEMLEKSVESLRALPAGGMHAFATRSEMLMLHEELIQRLEVLDELPRRRRK
jgi:hypothetical protein